MAAKNIINEAILPVNLDIFKFVIKFQRLFPQRVMEKK